MTPAQDAFVSYMEKCAGIAASTARAMGMPSTRVAESILSRYADVPRQAAKRGVELGRAGASTWQGMKEGASIGWAPTQEMLGKSTNKLRSLLGPIPGRGHYRDIAGHVAGREAARMYATGNTAGGDAVRRMGELLKNRPA